jgi:hypothetical protein
VYSGPSHTLEYSELSERITTVRVAGEGMARALGEVRGDVDALKAKAKDLEAELARVATAPHTLGGGIDADDPHRTKATEARLREVQYASARPQRCPAHL